jgi:hypothetical protein
MPRLISAKEKHLIEILKEYWTYQKHYYADCIQSFFESFLGAQGYLEDLRDWRFRSESYYASIALGVAKSVCLASESGWELLLISHGYHRKHDTTNYICMIIFDLKDLKRFGDDQRLNIRELPARLQQAIALVADPRYERTIYNRVEQLRIEVEAERPGLSP